MNRKSITVLAALGLMLVTKALLADSPQEQNFDADGTRLAYFVAGEGPPVVLLHAFSQSTQKDWVATGIFDQLVANYRVIALDARGHGRSEKSHDPDSYGVIMVDDVVRLLDHLRIDQAHVVTYSMGGYIAIKMATLYPERIKSLVLGGAGWLDAQWDVLESAWEDQANELESEGIDAGDNDPLALAAVLRKEYELRVDEEDFRNWDMPTLAVIGDRDFLLPGVKALVQAVPHITVEILPGQDHQSALGDPQFATAVQGFLAAESAR
jgi:pimeloyl-ACP methyl ester carboxylesterase